jgi:hypothetical protein
MRNKLSGLRPSPRRLAVDRCSDDQFRGVFWSVFGLSDALRVYLFVPFREVGGGVG